MDAAVGVVVVVVVVTASVSAVDTRGGAGDREDSMGETAPDGGAAGVSNSDAAVVSILLLPTPPPCSWLWLFSPTGWESPYIPMGLATGPNASRAGGGSFRWSSKNMAAAVESPGSVAPLRKPVLCVCGDVWVCSFGVCGHKESRSVGVCVDSA